MREWNPEALPFVPRSRVSGAPRTEGRRLDSQRARGAVVPPAGATSGRRPLGETVRGHRVCEP